MFAGWFRALLTALPSGRLYYFEKEDFIMAWGYGKYAGRSRRRNARRYNARRRSRQMPARMPEQSSVIRDILGSPQFTDALLGALSGIPGGPGGMLKGAAVGALRGSWRGRRPPREEGEGHPGGWQSRGKRRGY